MSNILSRLIKPKKKEPTVAEMISNIPTQKDVQKIMENIEGNKEKEKYWNSLRPRLQEKALRIAVERQKRRESK